MAITKTNNKSSGNAQLKSDGSTASRLITPAKPKNVNIKVSPNHPIKVSKRCTNPRFFVNFCLI